MEDLSFYRKIEDKVCGECGNQMDEQCESYLMICEKCLRNQEE